MAGLNLKLLSYKALPFLSTGTLLSQITPATFLHPLPPACTLFLHSLTKSPLLCTVDLKCLNSSTLTTWAPCNRTVPLPPFSFNPCMYSVLVLLTFSPIIETLIMTLHRQILIISMAVSLSSLMVNATWNIIVIKQTKHLPFGMDPPPHRNE